MEPSPPTEYPDGTWSNCVTCGEEVEMLDGNWVHSETGTAECFEDGSTDVAEPA